MVDGRHFENVKCNISTTVLPILMKFGMAMHISKMHISKMSVYQKF